ncbi:MAG: hypothetical protein ACE5D3_02145 [Candidatus Binatia bacterium]
MSASRRSLDLPVLAGLTVTDLDGSTVELKSLWQNRRAVVSFLRHFG